MTVTSPQKEQQHCPFTSTPGPHNLPHWSLGLAHNSEFRAGCTPTALTGDRVPPAPTTLQQEKLGMGHAPTRTHHVQQKLQMGKRVG